MGYYMAITGIKPDGTKTDFLIVGKCYGYNEPQDGLMLGYVYIIQSESFRESMQEEREELKGYTDYDIVDVCFTARGSWDITFDLNTFYNFLSAYSIDRKYVMGYEVDPEDLSKIVYHLKGCSHVFVEWF